MDRKEQAVLYKHQGMNCAQAVLAVFAEDMGTDPEYFRKLGAAFGLGMGRMEGTCGALVGAEMLLGLRKFEGKPVLRDASAALNTFRERCGATLCKDLKGRDTGVVICDCDDCVRAAVEIAEGFF